MNVDLGDITIPLICGDKRYQITVRVENPLSSEICWWAYGSDYSNPMESPIGWGSTPDLAVENFLKVWFPEGQPTSVNQG
jgi:hypothetical protein